MAKDRTQIQLALAKISTSITAQRGRMGLLQHQLDDSEQRLAMLESRVDAHLERLEALLRIA